MSRLGPTLTTAINRFAETAINKALALDSASRFHLDAIEGCTLKLCLTPPGATFYISFQTDRVKFNLEPNEPQLTVSGSPLDLFSLIQNSGDETEPARTLEKESLQPEKRLLLINQIQFSGDLQQANRIRLFLASLNIDWESGLADKTGDITAHFIGRRIRAFLRWNRLSRKTLIQNVEDYIRDESQQFPSHQELIQNKERIEQLYQKTQALENHIKQLTLSKQKEAR